MTTEVLFSNNGYSTLAAGISSTDTTLTLTASTGARFPVVAAGQQFRGTIFDANGNREIVLVTARAADVLTIARSQEGTTARAWLAGDGFELRLTAGGLATFPQVDKDNNFSGANKFTGTTMQQTAPNYGGVSTGAAETYGVTLTPALNAPAAGMEVRFQAHQANATATPTFSVNGSAAEALVKRGGQPLGVGDIAGGAEYTVRKRAVGWEIVSPLAGMDLSLRNTWTKSQVVAQVTLADAAIINTDASLSDIFVVTLGGNRTLANPTNLVAGQVLVWHIRQDAVGGRTLAYGSMFKFANGNYLALSTAANAKNVLSGVYDGADLLCTLQPGFM